MFAAEATIKSASSSKRALFFFTSSCSSSSSCFLSIRLFCAEALLLKCHWTDQVVWAAPLNRQSCPALLSANYRVVSYLSLLWPGNLPSFLPCTDRFLFSSWLQQTIILEEVAPSSLLWSVPEMSESATLGKKTRDRGLRCHRWSDSSSVCGSFCSFQLII